jgi:flagellar L-ring protein precursor FlgH
MGAEKMKKYFLIFLVLGTGLIFLPGKVLADSIYPLEGANSIYTEKRAHRVGDVITVLIQESTQGAQGASSNNQKAANVALGAGSGNLGAGTYGANLLNSTSQIGLGASSSHQGQGSSSQGATITGQMTAKIVSVLPNGNFQIEGTRYIAVNDDKQTVEVVGEIRPDDISRDNTIPSSRVADAKIKIIGSGPSSETAKPGLLTRVFSWLGLF